jgi:TolB-like protein/DNA-binding winged helix-turn-helix (wHTH) protein/Flp pilus assembly protein TadD
VTITQINLAETPDFDLGGLRVNAARRRVAVNGSARELELEPRVAQVLVALALARPEVVSRDRLIDQCWDGRIVGDDALNRCIVALRHLAKEFSPEPYSIETVPRVGYRLIEGEMTAKPRPRRWSLKRIAAVAMLVVLLLVAGAWALGVPGPWQRDPHPTSIAVLPFRNLSAGDPYFAQGIGEEILGQLAREPQFRVAGSTSSSRLGASPDVREAARKLNVDYVLEGSVRRQGNDVRINADLLRARDGVRMWSDTFDGKLDDVLAIQSAIGQAVATGLRRKLVAASPDIRRRVNGEAYALYLNARGLIRSYNPQTGHDALTLLKETVRIDPGFAPAWASLAEAVLLDGRTKGNEGMIAVMPQARDAATRALRLDPDLAQAHAVYADLVGLDSPEGIAHLQRAAELEPRSGEGMMWRAMALHASGRFAEAYAAFGRAHDLDPLWPIPMRTIGDNKALSGDRPGAEAFVRRAYDEPMLQSFALARAAWFSGDFSEAARRWAALAQGQSQWASPSTRSRDNALFMLKLSNAPPARPPRPTIGQNRTTPANVWMSRAPPPAEWQRRNRSSAAELVYRDENVIAAKLMLGAGRAAELAATYDGPTGLLGIRRGQKIGTCYLQNAARVALALRAVGRAAEAEKILTEADAAIRGAYGRGIVPTWFDEDAAGIWALQGKRDLAVTALERALRRGSAHATRTDLPRLADEPALRSLRGYPAFQAVLAKYDAHFARERLETARALHIAAA